MRSRSRWRLVQKRAWSLVDALGSEPSRQNSHLLPSVRGDLLAKLGCFEEARAEFERAASLTSNARERELLLERTRTCAPASRSTLIF